MEESIGSTSLLKVDAHDGDQDIEQAQCFPRWRVLFLHPFSAAKSEPISPSAALPQNYPHRRRIVPMKLSLIHI